MSGYFGGGGASVGGAVTGGTEGSVLFLGAAGVLAQDNAGLYYHTATNQLRLAAGAATDSPLKITLAAAQTADAFQVYASDGTTKLASITSAGGMTVLGNGAGKGYLIDTGSGSSNSFLDADNGGRVFFGGNGYTDFWCALSGLYVGHASNMQLAWSSTISSRGAADVGLFRHSAGVIRVTDSSTGIKGFLGGGAAVASATALPLPTGRVFHVTGTTTITSITSTNFQSGAVITLIFDGALTFTDGNNLKLAGNFVTTADDTITLAYDGTNWYEVCRSVN